MVDDSSAERDETAVNSVGGSNRKQASDGSVVLHGDLTDTAPECPCCGSALEREQADGAWLECPSGDYAFDAETGEAYVRAHDSGRGRERCLECDYRGEWDGLVEHVRQEHGYLDADVALLSWEVADASD